MKKVVEENGGGGWIEIDDGHDYGFVLAIHEKREESDKEYACIALDAPQAIQLAIALLKMAEALLEKHQWNEVPSDSLTRRRRRRECEE